MFEVGGIIKKWHLEIIDGRRVRVIEKFMLTEVFLNHEHPTPLAVDVSEYSVQIEKIAKEIASVSGVPPKYWQNH